MKVGTIEKEKQFEVDFVVCEKNKAIELFLVTHHIDEPTSKLYKREAGGLVTPEPLTGMMPVQPPIFRFNSSILLSSSAQTAEH